MSSLRTMRPARAATRTRRAPRRSRGYSSMKLAAVFVTALAVCSALVACTRGPAGPGEGPLATGRWTGDGACLSVTDTGCNLAVGCGHGQFARPVIRADGVFDV